MVLNERKKTQERVVALDYIRFLAILCVILSHSTENTYALNPDFLCSVAPHVRWSGLAFFTIGRLGVPLFLFLTGYLMLDREYNSEQTVNLWKNKVLCLWMTTEIWIIVYYFFYVCFLGTDFSMLNLIKQMLFLNNSYGPHIWYMPTILGLYIFIPFVANGIKRYDDKIFLLPMILAIPYLYGVSLINTFTRIIWGRHVFFNMLDISFSGGNYGVLLILGWMVKKGYFKHIKNTYWFAFAMFGYVSTLALELWAYSRGVEYNVWYDSITLLIAGFSIFNLLLGIKNSSRPAMINWFSKTSFAVYLCHYIVMNLLARHIHIASYELRAIVLCALTGFISYLIVFSIQSNKKVSKVLFNLK